MSTIAKIESAFPGISVIELNDSVHVTPDHRTLITEKAMIDYIDTKLGELGLTSIETKIDAMQLDVTDIRQETFETEVHVHSHERWMGLAGTPSGETHRMDGLLSATSPQPFQIDAGNNDWGAWVQVVGSADTPIQAGKTHFNFHELQMTGNEKASDYFIQLAYDSTAAAALTAGAYSEKVLTFDGLNAEKFFLLQSVRHVAGTKVWARCKCPGENTATLDFYIGFHEYNDNEIA